MNGEPLTVDSWARARQTDLQIFVQETHHARRLDPASYDKRDAETWDTMFSAWLIAKGRVRAPQPQFLWAMPEGAEQHETEEGGVVVHLPFGEPQDPQNPNVSEVSEILNISDLPPAPANVESLQKTETRKKAKAAR